MVVISSGQGLLHALQLCLELSKFVKGDIDSFLLNGAIRLANLENKYRACLVNILAIRRGDFMAEYHLEVAQLLQSHQARHRVKTVGFTSLSFNSTSKRLNDLRLLYATSSRNLLHELRLGPFNIFRPVRR